MHAIGVMNKVRREWSKNPFSPVLSRVEGKAAALWTRGAYSQYVSTAKERERC